MIDLNTETKKIVAALLAQVLADSIDLEYQLKQAHWNVRGCSFIALHELFDKLAGEVRSNVDEIAERIVQLGALPKGTVRAAAGASSLPEFPLQVTAQEEVLAALIVPVAKYAADMRAAIDAADKAGDKDTADLLTGVSRSADKMLWFLKAHSKA
jgi:starvation-inducible DNA-binding protein